MPVVLVALVTLADLALGLRSIVSGTLATLMTGAVVGMLILE
jgi:nucleoside permease NupC